jgi:hypothetical protein
VPIPVPRIIDLDNGNEDAEAAAATGVVDWAAEAVLWGIWVFNNVVKMPP